MNEQMNIKCDNFKYRWKPISNKWKKLVYRSKEASRIGFSLKLLSLIDI
jgi:hypothetical protein